MGGGGKEYEKKNNSDPVGRYITQRGRIGPYSSIRRALRTKRRRCNKNGRKRRAVDIDCVLKKETKGIHPCDRFTHKTIKKLAETAVQRAPRIA